MSKCFLCNKVSTNVVWRENGYAGRLCGCGIVYTDPEPSPGVIDCTVNLHEEAFYLYPADLKAAWMARHCPRGRLLEVGCGDGFFLKAAQSYGYKVFGIEPDVTRAERAETLLGTDVERGFLEETSFPHASFDVVYHCDLLAHVADPMKFLSAMTALLRPGGVLCFEVGLLGGISPLWYKFLSTLGPGYHLWFYSDEAVRLLLLQTGLRIVSVQYFGLAPQAILGRGFGFLRRMAHLVVRSNPASRGQPLCAEIDNLYHRIIHCLRYSVGSFAPRIGPQTMLVVARPE